MSIQAVGLKAYTNALNNFKKAEQKAGSSMGLPAEKPAAEFSDVLKTSLEKVNDMRQERSDKILSFASGESQNVHELMISMQKASLAMSMTTTVRNKALEAYKELTRLQF